jgi:hypothetical protein
MNKKTNKKKCWRLLSVPLSKGKHEAHALTAAVGRKEAVLNARRVRLVFVFLYY